MSFIKVVSDGSLHTVFDDLFVNACKERAESLLRTA